MHRHDLDLIAGLADGSLGDESKALARVETCSYCRAEYEAQMSVLAALAVVGPSAMTDHEKAALHRDLWTELRTGAAAAAATPWWYRWSYAAAGLFVVVGLVAVLTQTGDEDSLESFNETGSSLGDSPAPADAAEAPAAVDGVTSQLAEEGESEPAADDSADLASAAEPVDFSALAQSVNERRRSGQSVAAADASKHDDCVLDSGLTDHSVIDIFSLEAGDYLAVVPNDAPEDSTEVSFVDLSTCEVVHTDG